MVTSGVESRNAVGLWEGKHPLGDAGLPMNGSKPYWWPQYGGSKP